MGFLTGKKILITGMVNNRSIAYGIAQACHQHGAELAFTYQGERFAERVQEFAHDFGSSHVFRCDVQDDRDIKEVSESLAAGLGSLDGIVHSIAFAPRDALEGDFLSGMSREAFRVAHDVSSYSFSALAKSMLPLLEGRNSSLLALTFLGSQWAVPGYNTMGLAKASLEANVRYVAASLGPGGVRANSLSAGPIRTLASSGVSSFGRLLKFAENTSMLKRNPTIHNVGQVAAFLLSDLALGITGQVINVDCGLSAALSIADEPLELPL